jgi:hypothetical protein
MTKPDDLTEAMRARLEALAANFAQTAAAQKDWSLSADVIADYEQRAADLRTLLSENAELRESVRLFEEEHIAWQETREGMHKTP